MSAKTPSRSVVVDFLKNQLNYRYKRGSSRSIASKTQKPQYLQKIFGCKMQEAINRGVYQINVDKASYLRSVKLSYTWLQSREYFNY